MIIQYEKTPGTGPATLKISQIRTDGGTQSRAAINDEVAGDYAEAIRAGEQFPRVIVFFDGEAHWLADGFHRHRAHADAGSATIDADIRQGTRRDAVLFSVGANAAHGLRRTNDDKRRAVLMLLEDAEWGLWSDREIARRCGVDHKTVSALREKLSGEVPQMRTVERGGTVYQQDTSAIGKGAANLQPTPIEDVDEREPEFNPMAVRPVKVVIPEVEKLIAGTARDNEKYRSMLKGLSPSEQYTAAKRDLALDKKDAENAAASQSIRDSLPQSIKDSEAARAERRAEKTDSSDSDADGEVEELQEIMAQQDATVVRLERELEKFESMKALFEKGGFEAVVAAKDDEIHTLQTRVTAESRDKAAWARKAKYWKEQAQKLGWQPPRGDDQSAPLGDDDAFYDVIEERA